VLYILFGHVGNPTSHLYCVHQNDPSSENSSTLQHVAYRLADRCVKLHTP